MNGNRSPRSRLRDLQQTRMPELARTADRWQDDAARPSCAHRALAYKAVFKVLYD